MYKYTLDLPSQLCISQSLLYLKQCQSFLPAVWAKTFGESLPFSDPASSGPGCWLIPSTLPSNYVWILFSTLVQVTTISF